MIMLVNTNKPAEPEYTKTKRVTVQLDGKTVRCYDLEKPMNIIEIWNWVRDATGYEGHGVTIDEAGNGIIMLVTGSDGNLERFSDGTIT